MKHEDEIDVHPETPLPDNGYRARSYVGVTLGENLGIEFTTEASFDSYKDYAEAMRVACEMLLQTYKQRLILESIAHGAFIGAMDLLNYSGDTKAEDLAEDGKAVDEEREREEEQVDKGYC
jgi:hypothetical protein